MQELKSTRQKEKNMIKQYFYQKTKLNKIEVEVSKSLVNSYIAFISFLNKL